jgi:hypothetical protein
MITPSNKDINLHLDILLNLEESNTLLLKLKKMEMLPIKKKILQAYSIIKYLKSLVMKILTVKTTNLKINPKMHAKFVLMKPKLKITFYSNLAYVQVHVVLFILNV